MKSGLRHLPLGFLSFPLSGTIRHSNLAALCLCLLLALGHAVALAQSPHHPWCPPFDLERIGYVESTNQFEADALVHTKPDINPVDLGTILVPHGWLLLGPEQSAEIEL